MASQQRCGAVVSGEFLRNVVHSSPERGLSAAQQECAMQGVLDARYFCSQYLNCELYFERLRRLWRGVSAFGYLGMYVELTDNESMSCEGS